MTRALARVKEAVTGLRWSEMSNYLFVVPALGMFLTFSLYPYIDVFNLSVRQYDGISPDKPLVWFRHFKDIIFSNESWWISFRNAAFITFLALTLQNFLALVLAWLVDRDVKGGQVYRSIYFLPPILSEVVVGLLWLWIFMPEYGLLNTFLGKIGMGKWQMAWFSDPDTALPALATVHMWKGFGWGFIILLAGLQGIPRQLYEAARVDGAGEWRIFWKITAPLMVPVFILVSILTILGTMQIYALVITTTAGGPGYHTEVPMKRMLDEIGQARLGYACAMGLVFGFILFAISMIQLQVSKRVKAD